jgi:hypothetical protein
VSETIDLKSRKITDETNRHVGFFLKKLTELSCEFGVGITGAPVLFLMEADDFERHYYSDADSRIEYR